MPNQREEDERKDAPEVGALRSRVRKVYETDALQPFSPSILWPDDKTHHVEWKDFEADYDYEENAVRLLSETARTERIRQKCDEFHDAVNLTNNDYFICLDHAFSSLFKCQWRLKDNLSDKIVEETCSYIARLPSTAAELPIELGSISEAYFENDSRTWESLRVVSENSTNAIRYIILCVIGDWEHSWVNAFGQEILNNVGEMIDATVWKSGRAVSQEEKCRWFIVSAFLWKFWQTVRIFSAAHEMQDDVRLGVHTRQDLWLRNFNVCEGLSLKAFTEAQSEIDRPRNLCSWALVLMRNHSHCLGLDFRHFFKRYRDLLGGFPIRCSKDGAVVCDGNHPHNCLRYKGLSVKEQSVHDEFCDWQRNGQHDHEPRLTWDEESYRAVDGPRAVSIKECVSNKMIYCKASERTIAISHVWSHGQGGRPETGMNQCLHQRYKVIAESLGCDSYWMDTPCIPADHQLRKEAIEQINKVFYQSHAIIVCDKDLMSIDTAIVSTDLFEAMLCAVILCDWNARAWTILEGLKGRSNVYILCKHNRVLNLKTIVEHLNNHGNLSIYAFAYQITHMLPRRDFAPPSNMPDWQDYSDRLQLEVVGSWLSNRPASRPGDEVVIWSLLLDHGAPPIFNLHDFWRQQKSVNTGFLLSSAKRLKEPGFSWAPESSYVTTSQSWFSHWFGSSGFFRDSTVYYPPMPSQITEIASIGPDGITGPWFVHEIRQDLLPMLSWRLERSSTECELNKIRSWFVRYGHVGALLRPITHAGVRGHVPAKAPKVPGDSKEGVLLAVCDSPQGIFWKREVKHRGPHNLGGPRNQWSYKWTWRGVYHWPRDIPLPEMHGRNFFWIS